MRIAVIFGILAGLTGFSARADFAPQTIKSFGLKNSKMIALTIDDGPTDVTPEMLDVLKENGVHATFFLIGMHAEDHLDTVKRIVAEGHLIGNHTYHHQMLLHMNKETQQYDCGDDKVAYDEIKRTNDILKPFVSPSQRRMYFRPPGGGWCQRYAPLMNNDTDLRRYVGPLYWSMGGSVYLSDEHNPNSPLLDAGDEDCWTTSHLSVDRCLEGYRASIKRLKGGVLLNHDVHIESVELLRRLIPELKAQGFKFITLDEVRSLDALQWIPPATFGHN